MLRDTTLCVLSTLNILLFTFLGLNQGALREKLNYTLPTAKAAAEFETIISQLQQNLSTSTLKVEPSTPVQTHSYASLPHAQPSTLNPQPSLSFLAIPKIHLLAPVHSNTQKDQIQETLEKGIISLKDDLHPGQTILFGHSSDYTWNENPYSTIFTLLPILQAGDHIQILKENQTQEYIVEKTVITDPELTGLASEQGSEKLILSTCYPLGFTSQRFNVIATPTP
ncbi:MAG: sortase [Candidatus Gracilibacteria bacterium]|nr:sortase [bacterium]MDZ4216957.1 sortase [Candidatus Gracilibacteria bacterium]